jgi:hypothetical protein
MSAAPGPKLKLIDHDVRREHRSGWRYAIESLAPLACDNGITTDTFIESSFVWHVGKKTASGELPYRRPWIGFLHNPVGIPEWHEYRSAPQVLFTQRTWQESLESCRGIITLSEDFAQWVRRYVQAPVQALVHPTEEPLQWFSFEAYTENPNKRVIQVGWWLRRMTSIHRLPLRKLTAAVLEPVGPNKIEEFRDVLRRERTCLGLPDVGTPAESLRYRTPEGFDQLLAENLAFADLFDATANNTVIECIVRHTPLLVNPLPAVLEYLGSQYPFYFTSLDEAARKAEDLGCVKAACDYLAALPKDKFTGEYFCNSLAQSKLYADLPHAL